MLEHKDLYDNSIHLFCNDALELYDSWESPVVIISDGPYGVNGFPGDLLSPFPCNTENFRSRTAMHVENFAEQNV